MLYNSNHFAFAWPPLWAFSKAHKTQGMPATSRYLPVFKRGDYVDIVVDASIQKGMPYGFYHGRTGVYGLSNGPLLLWEWFQQSEFFQAYRNQS